MCSLKYVRAICSLLSSSAIVILVVWFHYTKFNTWMWAMQSPENYSYGIYKARNF